MDDKFISWDCLKDQKYMVNFYTTMCTEIANQNLLTDTVKMCSENVRAAYDIFNVMQQNGWYQTQPADQQTLAQAASKAQQLSMQQG